MKKRNGKRIKVINKKCNGKLPNVIKKKYSEKLNFLISLFKTLTDLITV